MFKLVIFSTLFVAVFALPVDHHHVEGVDQPHVHHPIPVVPIEHQENENKGDGSFHFGFVSGDGTKVEEHGALKIIDEKTAEEIVQGMYEYVSPEGRNIKVEYYADGTGFHAFSDDIPKSAGVHSLAEFAHYTHEGQKYQGVHHPLVAARALDFEKTEKPTFKHFEQPIYNAEKDY